MRHFLFGYGSLISRESRHATGKTGKAEPIQVQDMRRSWNVAAPKMQMVGVGIVPEQAAICNGVLIEINEGEIASFDKREINDTDHSYARAEIEFKKIIGLHWEFDPSDKVWTYIVIKPCLPSREFPILQSYVDVILSGCLEISHEFAMGFICNTDGWENPWDNDRTHPKYIRHLKEVKFQYKIDELLEKFAPSGFAARKDI